MVSKVPPPPQQPEFGVRPLQVGTSDGRVKVVGREGVEAAIPSLSSTGTRHLQFLPNRGAVLRVNQVQCCLLVEWLRTD